MNQTYFVQYPRQDNSEMENVNICQTIKTPTSVMGKTANTIGPAWFDILVLGTWNSPHAAALCKYLYSSTKTDHKTCRPLSFLFRYAS